MYVEGRSKDVIINESGENIYPDEIEDISVCLRAWNNSAFWVSAALTPNELSTAEKPALHMKTSRLY